VASLKRWRYQCQELVHPSREVCKMRAEPESHSLTLTWPTQENALPLWKDFKAFKITFSLLLVFSYHLTRVCCPEILQGSDGNHDITPYNPGHWKWSIISAEKSLWTRCPLHRTSWREVLPTRAIRNFINSIGKRTLPTRRILSSGHSEPTSAPSRMDDMWSGNSFLLGSSSLANHGG